MKKFHFPLLLLSALLATGVWLIKTPDANRAALADGVTYVHVADHTLPDDIYPSPATAFNLAQYPARYESEGYELQENGEAMVASNGRHGFSAQWSTETGALRLESLDASETWRFSMAMPDAPRHVSAEGETLTFSRAGVDEWFRNDPRGLAHGFVVSERPAKSNSDGLRVSLEIDSSLVPAVTEDRTALAFSNATGEARLHYRGLLAYDADARLLPARLELAAAGDSGGLWELAFHVDDRDARYPVTIDPVFTTRIGSLISQPTVAGNRFGEAVSLSDDWLAVGVPHAETQGAVDLYRFDRALRYWEKSARLTPDGAVSGGLQIRFGAALRIEAGTLIIGAPGDAGSGAVYLFERGEGAEWSQTDRILAPDAQPGAQFGASVGLNQNLAAIGAPGHPSGAAVNAGRAYVIHRNPEGAWTPPSQLLGYAPVGGDRFGESVSVSTMRVAVGAPKGQFGVSPVDAGICSVHQVGLDFGGTPITLSSTVLIDANPGVNENFGSSVALQGLSLLVGSPGKNASAGAVSRFQLTGGNWLWQGLMLAPSPQAGALFGAAIAFSGDTLAIGAPGFDETALLTNVGAAYLFDRSPAGDWQFLSRQLRIKKQASGHYGTALAIDADHIATGVPNNWVFVMGDEAGEVETFNRDSAAWLQALHHDPSQDSGHELGRAVAIDGGQAVIGHPGWLQGNDKIGAITVQASHHTGPLRWGTTHLLTNPDAQHESRFGAAVAIAGDWMLVGAPDHDIGGLANAGKAYLFRRTAMGVWQFYKSLDVPGLPAGAEYGAAVALTTRWAFVGAPGSNHAYVFDRYEGGTDFWDVSTILNESAGGGRFGSAIAVDGNQTAISAPRRAGVAPAGQIPATIQAAGRVKIYQTAQVGGEEVWVESVALPQPAPDGSFGSLNATFGASLAFHSGLLVAGEPGFSQGSGRARVFGPVGAVLWADIRTLTAPSSTPGDMFGAAVAAGPRWIFAGAPAANGKGVVYSFDRALFSSFVNPLASTLVHSRGREGDGFGAALAFGDNALMVGMPNATSALGEPDAGSWIVFHRQPTAWHPLGGPLGSPAGTGDQLGRAVSADGEFMAAGAPFDNISGNPSAGSVHLYRRNPLATTGWSHLKTLTASDIQTGATFGFSLVLRGDTLAVGAPGWDSHGAVYLFQRHAGGTDNWGQVKRVDHPLLAAGDDFGNSVGLHGDLLAVGAPGRNAGAVLDAGAVYAFGRDHDGTLQWGYLDQFTKTLPVAFDFFGSSVAVADERILVGSPLSDERGDASGAAYVFGRIGGLADFVLLATLSPVNNVANNRLGGAVAWNGDHAALGAIGDATHAVESGAAWIFRDMDLDGTNWLNVQKITIGAFENPAVHNGLRLGASVAILGDRVCIGAIGYDEGASVNIGAAYIFERNQGHANAWGFQRRLSRSDAGTGARLGFSVALADDFAFVGAPEADQGAQTDAGYVYVFGDIGTAYETWARARFGDAAVNDPFQKSTLWGPNADSDQDGLVNALEAFMGFDPQIPNRRSPVTSVRQPDGTFVMTFRRAKNTYGVTGRVTWSRDLAEWNIGVNPDFDDIHIETRLIASHADHDIIEARVSGPQLATEPRFFLRLEVNTP